MPDTLLTYEEYRALARRFVADLQQRLGRRVRATPLGGRQPESPDAEEVRWAILVRLSLPPYGEGRAGFLRYERGLGMKVFTCTDYFPVNHPEPTSGLGERKECGWSDTADCYQWQGISSSADPRYREAMQFLLMVCRHKFP